MAVEDGSSIQSQSQTEAQESTAESVPGLDRDTRQSWSANHSWHSQNSDIPEYDDGATDLRSIYQNLLGIIPDPIFSYTDSANPSTLGSFTSPDPYCDRSQLLNVILKGLPTKEDAINMMNTYYERVAIECVLVLIFLSVLVHSSYSGLFIKLTLSNYTIQRRSSSSRSSTEIFSHSML